MLRLKYNLTKLSQNYKIKINRSYLILNKKTIVKNKIWKLISKNCKIFPNKVKKN